MSIIYEATCTRCWEKFNPQPSLTRTWPPKELIPPDSVWHEDFGFTPDDMIHGQREDGAECGGDGQLEGAWTTD